MYPCKIHKKEKYKKHYGFDAMQPMHLVIRWYFITLNRDVYLIHGRTELGTTLASISVSGKTFVSNTNMD